MKNIRLIFCFYCLAAFSVLPLSPAFSAQDSIVKPQEIIKKDKLIIQPHSAEKAPDEHVVEFKPEDKKEQPVKLAEAKNSYIEIMPASAVNDDTIDTSGENTTHQAIRMTPDKSELLKLDEPAATVIVGNPNHVSVLADSANSLILVARAPGATHFTALNDGGEVIMSRHVIVGSPKKKYMRIRRSCAGTGDNSCAATQVYYCPDMCHEILLNVEQEEDQSRPDADEASPDALSDATAGEGSSE